MGQQSQGQARMGSWEWGGTFWGWSYLRARDGQALGNCFSLLWLDAIIPDALTWATLLRDALELSTSKGIHWEFTSRSAGFLRQLGHPPDEDRGTAQSSSASWASVALILCGRLIRSWQPHGPRRISNVFFRLWLVPLLVMPLVLSTAVSYPKLTDVKHPAGSAHRFRGSGILEGPSGDSSSLLHHIRSFSWDDLPGAGGFYFQCAFFTCISDTPGRDGWSLGSGGTVTEDLQMVSIAGVQGSKNSYLDTSYHVVIVTNSSRPLNYCMALLKLLNLWGLSSSSVKWG